MNDLKDKSYQENFDCSLLTDKGLRDQSIHLKYLWHAHLKLSQNIACESLMTILKKVNQEYESRGLGEKVIK